MRDEDIAEACLVEMFRRVGLPMTDLAAIQQWAKTQGDQWYKTRSWTDAEEEDFRKWMYAFLRKKTRRSAAACRSQAKWFLLEWGWTTQPSTATTVTE